jgi:hypothetical protein
MGGSSVKNVQTMLPQQQQFLENVFGQTQQQAPQALLEALGGQGPLEENVAFQQQYVDPAMLAFERSILPAIESSAAFSGASSSSALNQALAQAAQDTMTMLGGQYGQMQNQRQMQALGLLGQLTGQKAFEPVVQQRSGILGPLINAGAKVGAAYLGG